MRKRSRQYLLKIKAKNNLEHITSVDQLEVNALYKFKYAGVDRVNMFFLGRLLGRLVFANLDGAKKLLIHPGPLSMYKQKEVIKL